MKTDKHRLESKAAINSENWTNCSAEREYLSDSFRLDFIYLRSSAFICGLMMLGFV